MKLKEYLDQEGLRYKAFAKKIDVTYISIYNIFKGKGVRLNTALKIEKATNGKVTCLDLIATDQILQEKEDPNQLKMDFLAQEHVEKSQNNK